MNLVFGRNRRQNPLRIICPGGEIRVSRKFGGAVLIEVVGGNGRVEIPKEPLPYLALVQIRHEEKEPA